MKGVVLIDFVSKIEITTKVKSQIKDYISKVGVSVLSIDVSYLPIIPPPYCGKMNIKFDEPKSGMMEKLQPKVKEFLLSLGVNATVFIYMCLIPEIEGNIHG